MIVRGIVTNEEAQEIKTAAIENHQLEDNLPGSFIKWEEDGATWVEVDVNENLMGYLKNSGFFT